MLSEISQRKTNTVWYHLYVESKKMKLVNITSNRFRKQTSEERGAGEGHDQGRGLRGTNYHV